MIEQNKQYTLTEEEFNLLFSILEKVREDVMYWAGGEQLSLDAARLENELLWQHKHGQRRPVQH